MFFFQAEDGIRDLVRSRGLGDVYKRQDVINIRMPDAGFYFWLETPIIDTEFTKRLYQDYNCLLYTSDAADERSSVDLGGRRIIKKKNNKVLNSP